MGCRYHKRNRSEESIDLLWGHADYEYKIPKERPVGPTCEIWVRPPLIIKTPVVLLAEIGVVPQQPK